MTDKYKKINIFALAVLMLTLVAAVLRTLSLVTVFESDTGYYQLGAALPTVLNILCVLAVAAFAAFPLFFIKKDEVAVPPMHKACRYVAILPAIAFALLTAKKWSAFFGAAEFAMEQKNLFLVFLPPVLTLFALIFFVLACTGLKATALTAAAGSFAIISFAVELALSYTDMTVPMNSPNKLMSHFAYIGIMLFLLAELRALWQVRKDRLYFFSAAVAVFFTGSYSVPVICAPLSDGYTDTATISDFAVAAVFLFSAVRLLTLGISFRETPEAESNADTEIEDDPEKDDQEAPEAEPESDSQ